MGDQEFIQSIMDGIYPKLNQAGSSYYLPTFITNNHYDPYGPFSWNIGQLKDQDLLNSAASICPSIDIVQGGVCSNPDQMYITAAIPPNYPTLSVVNSSVGGLKNALSQRPMAQAPDGRTVIMTIAFGTLPSFPAPITLSGNFTFTSYCCCSNDGKVCAGPPQPAVGMGTFTAMMPNPQTSPAARGNAVITFNITALAPGVLTLVVQSVKFQPPMEATGGPSMAVSINITSIPPGSNPQSYSNVAMKAFNSPEARQSIVNSMNGTLNAPGNLATFSDLLTKEIDGYLRENHMYPFDGSTVAIV
jgi:hypothetical protein